MYTDTHLLAEKLVGGLKQALDQTRPTDLLSIRSIYLSGSYPRGDWLDSSSDLDITMTIEFRQPVGKQKKRVSDVENAFAIINSRTFTLLEEIEAIKKAGLAKGGSLDNAVVIGMDEIVNPQGLRYRKELVNHKILDLIGDLYTSGYRIMGKVEAFKTGHHLNNLLLKELFSNPDNYDIY